MFCGLRRFATAVQRSAERRGAERRGAERRGAERRSVVLNLLGHDEVGLVVKSVISSTPSSPSWCEDVMGFVTVFARRGSWRQLALFLGWADVHEKRQFMQRCYTLRHTFLAAQCQRQSTSSRALVQRDMNTTWVECNRWVVPGLVVTEYAFELLTQYKMHPTGKKDVYLHGNTVVRMGVAMFRIGPFGTEYAVRLRHGRVCPLLPPVA